MTKNYIAIIMIIIPEIQLHNYIYKIKLSQFKFYKKMSRATPEKVVFWCLDG